MSFEHHKRPEPGKTNLTSASGDAGHGPGKRTLTEALPHHGAGHAGGKAGHADAADHEGTGSASVKLVDGKPPRAAPAVEPPKQSASSEPAPLAHAAAASGRTSIEDAIRRYAPVVVMAVGEANRPADAGEYIRNSSLKWSHDSGRKDDPIAAVGQIDQKRLGKGGYKHQTEGLVGGPKGRQIPSNADVRPKDKTGDGGNEGFFLDLDNKHRASQRSGTDAPVYYQARDGHYICYWFFYAFNDGPTQGKLDGADDHEGDWERIVIHLDANNHAIEAAYHQHDGHKTLPWSAVTKQGKTHPIVYSAKGSHASYETPGAKPIYHNVKGKQVQIATDQASAGAQWHAEPNLVRAEDQDWYGYGGAWGEVGDFEMTTGPQGPSRHKPPAPKGW